MMVLITCSLYPDAYQQDTGDDGLVLMEAENHNGNTQVGGYSWVEVFSPSGYSGNSAYQAQPEGCQDIAVDYTSLSPRLDYQVNFTHTGTHYVWLYARGDSTSSNSLHVGLDGMEVTSASTIQIPAGAGWVWSTDRGSGLVATVEIDTTGIHTINIWMHEGGAYIDKLLLTTNAAFVPTGIDPKSTRYGVVQLLRDDFNDGNSRGWSVVDHCVKGASAWSVLDYAYQQSGDCRGYSVDGVAIGSIAVNDILLPANVDIQLRLRSLNPKTDSNPSNDITSWTFGTIGLVFGYQDIDNYYRVDLNGSKGHRKLWRKQAGTFKELNVSPQSYPREQWLNLRVISQHGVVLVFVDGQLVLAAQDAAFSDGRIGLFCARDRACSFDDVVVKTAPADPMLGLNLPDASSPPHASSEYYVETNNTLHVAALNTTENGIGGVEFLLDEGLVGEVARSDFLPPYAVKFTGLTTGNHTVTGYLLDLNKKRLTTPESTVTLPQIGTSGIHLLAMGDSITNGQMDDVGFDDVSRDARNTGGGYAPILNNYLTTSNGVSVTVRNEGNHGETSWRGAARVDDLLKRNPEAQAYLVSYGANDSGRTTKTPAGLGLKPGDTGYAGSFKDNIQKIIDAIVSNGKAVFLIKTSPYINNPIRDAVIVQYNHVIDELVTENRLGYVPADLHTYFTAHPSEMDVDGIHPNGEGYVSIARMICQQLNGQMGWACVP